MIFGCCFSETGMGNTETERTIGQNQEFISGRAPGISQVNLTIFLHHLCPTLSRYTAKILHCVD